LRRLVNKSLGGHAIADDYTLHVGAVRECGSSNRVSKIIQEELDRRHAQAIHQLRDASRPSQILAYWAANEKVGNVAGAFWAALTHPHCDRETHDAICGAMHMIQHQAGASARLEQSRFDQLSNEHRILTAELGKVQTRCTTLINQKLAEIAKLNEELMNTRGTIIAKDTMIAALRAELAELREAAPDLPARAALKQRVTELVGQLQIRNRQIAQMQRSLDGLQKQSPADRVQVKETDVEPPLETEIESPVQLKAKVVLCVGGRDSIVSRYRDSIENIGGRFAHHDGGIEDNFGRLEGSLAAADLVICQTGCVSHNAYWRVKDHCKRTGKRCVFVDNPSHSSFDRALTQIARIEDISDAKIDTSESNSDECVS
jgi:hypothetical protein